MQIFQKLQRIPNIVDYENHKGEPLKNLIVKPPMYSCKI